MFVNRCHETEHAGMHNEAYDMSNMATMGGCCSNTCPPIMECPQERVCHREMCYEVPHIIPVNTRIINHHVYRHTYQPMYTCTMEDTVSNVYDNKCGF